MSEYIEPSEQSSPNGTENPQPTIFQAPDYSITLDKDYTLRWEPALGSTELGLALCYHFPMERDLEGRMRAALKVFVSEQKERLKRKSANGHDESADFKSSRKASTNFKDEISGPTMKKRQLEGAASDHDSEIPRLAVAKSRVRYRDPQTSRLGARLRARYIERIYKNDANIINGSVDGALQNHTVLTIVNPQHPARKLSLTSQSEDISSDPVPSEGTDLISKVDDGPLYTSSDLSNGSTTLVEGDDESLAIYVHTLPGGMSTLNPKAPPFTPRSSHLGTSRLSFYEGTHSLMSESGHPRQGFYASRGAERMKLFVTGSPGSMGSFAEPFMWQLAGFARAAGSIFNG